LGETAFVQVSTTWALTCLETVHMTREIETRTEAVQTLLLLLLDHTQTTLV